MSKLNDFSVLKKNVLDRLNDKAFESTKEIRESVSLNFGKNMLKEDETNDLPNIEAAAEYIRKNGMPGLGEINRFKSEFNISLAQVMRHMIAPKLDDENGEIETNVL